jgi:hypothetical protein
MTQRAGKKKATRESKIEVIDNNDLAIENRLPQRVVVVRHELIQKIEAICDTADTWTDIESDNDHERSGELYAALNDAEKSLTKARKETVKPYKEFAKEIEEAARPLIERLIRCRNGIFEKMKAYRDEVERRRKKALKDAEEREQLNQTTPVVFEQAQPKEDMVVRGPAVSSHVSTRIQKVLEIVDIDAIPIRIGNMRILVPDEKRIMTLLKGGIDVPGCRIGIKEIPVSKPIKKIE